MNSDHPIDPAVRADIQARLSAIEAEHGQPIPAINAFIDSELTRLEAAAPPAPREVDFSVLDQLLLDTVLVDYQNYH